MGDDRRLHPRTDGAETMIEKIAFTIVACSTAFGLVLTAVAFLMHNGAFLVAGGVLLMTAAVAALVGAICEIWIDD